MKILNKNIIIAVVSIIYASLIFSVQGKTYNVDSALKVLDKVIEQKSYYELQKHHRITRYRYALNNAANDFIAFNMCTSLFSEYRSYNMDSAYYFAKTQLKIAKNLNSEDSVYVAMMNEADGLKGLAKLDQADDILHSIPLNDFINKSPYYYHLLHSVTLLRYSTALDNEERAKLNKQLLNYRECIAKVNPSNTVGWIINQAELYKLLGNYDKALHLLETYLKSNTKEGYSNATLLLTLSEIYKLLNNENAHKYYLTLSAIQDKINCKKTYTSLQRLAMLLNKEGDTERAYKYITCALDDIISSDAKNRLNQVAEMMPIITLAYSQQQAHDKTRRDILTGCVIALLIAFLIALIFLYMRNRKLNSVQLIVDKKNEELNKLNVDLVSLNKQLSDSNKIKEEYIAHLFNLCSGYIEEIDKFKTSVGRKIKTGQVKDIDKMLKEASMKNDLHEFFGNFDGVFLDLFPNFIDDFNNLLLPEGRLYPKEGELLSPELRIYALVRLGINDSTKIANFLHFSPQTVYNYRQRVRNKAIGGKDTFLEKVQKI